MYKYTVIFILAIIFFCYFSFAYSKYYNGNVSDHFDGSRFFDSDLNNEKNFFDFLKWTGVKNEGIWDIGIKNC